MTDSTKSTWVQFRDWIVGKAHHIIDLLTPSSDALAKAIPAGLEDTVDNIIKQAVTIAEQTGGGGQAKFEAALAAILPQLEGIGITLGKALLQILVSNAVIALGFSSSVA